MNLDSNTCELDGIYLIEASAGTGKTYNIQNLAVRLILEKGLKIDQILIVTFTRAATAELCDRIRKILQSFLDFLSSVRYEKGTPVLPEGKEREKLLLSRATEDFLEEKNTECRKKLKEALLDFDENAISTIDGFCQKMLSRNAFESGIFFDTELIDQANMYEEVEHLLRNQWRKLCYDPGNHYVGLYRGLIDLDHHFEELKNTAADEFFLAPERNFDHKSANQIDLRNLIERSEIEYDAEECTEPEETLAERIVDQIHFLSGYAASVTLPKKIESIPAAEHFPGKEETEIWENIAAAREETICEDPAIREIWFPGLENLRSDMQKLRVLLLRKIRRAVLKEFQIWKNQRNCQTFRDLQQRMIEALEKSPALRIALRNQFKAAVIDEFQDTDPRQYKIFMDVFSPAPARLFLVGDPKQAIYAFRGGDIFTYKQAVSEIRLHGEDHILSLNTNFRSADLLVQSVNDLFSDHTFPFADPGICFQPSVPSGKQTLIFQGVQDRSPLHFLTNAEEQQTNYSVCAEKILDLLNGNVLTPDPSDESKWNPVQPSDIAILFRNMKGNAQNMIAALKEKGIPCVLQEDCCLYDSQEAKDLLHLLEAAAEPEDTYLVLIFMQTNLAGNAGCREIICNPGFQNQENVKALIGEVQKKLFIIGKTYREKGFLAAFTCFEELFSIHRVIPALQNGEQRYSNLLQLRDILLREEKNGKKTEKSVITWLKQQIHPQTRTEFSENIFLSTDSSAVRIMTIHKSKGLQFPVVFLPDLTDANVKESAANYHDPAQNNRFVAKAPLSEQTNEYPKLEALQEEIRIAYVAMTRAARACYLILKEKTKNLNALNWLFYGKNIFRNGTPQQDMIIDAFSSLMQSEECPQLPEWIVPEEIRLSDAVYQPPEPEPVVPLIWSAEIPPAPVKLSYSEIHKLFRKKYDLKTSGEEEIPAKLSPAADRSGSESGKKTVLPEVFTLPKGDLFGTACHTILEILDFQKPEQLPELIRRYLSAVNIGDGEKAATAETMFRNVITAPIPCDDNTFFSLQEIGMNDRCSEMEFDFRDPEGFRAVKLAVLINQSFEPERKRCSLPPLDPVCPAVHSEAFYTGIADLICRYRGKYYIIDWKTDILDSDFSNFLPEKLFQPMWEKFYLYQSLLYSAVLIRFLSFRTGLTPEQVYDQQFGGVRYLFLRGMDPAVPGRGIFSCKPSFELLNEIAGGLS